MNLQPIEPIGIAILVGLACYIAIIALIPKRFMADSTHYTRNMLQKLASEKNYDTDDESDSASLLRGELRSYSAPARIFFALPGTSALYPKLLKAGLTQKIGSLFAKCLIILVLALYAFKKTGLFSLPLAIMTAYLFGYWYINRQIRRRNDAFINNFPDALDMIVRSVRSGYPMNSAVRMVADNMQAPVSTEFKQVADEIAYGSTLIDALSRLASRIDEPDVNFFVVVLTVQQDIGGNLSEVLNNLSNIIRKRKHMRMKIRALSAEGRTSAWVLGSMPVIETLLILIVSPTHLTPLFNNDLGNEVLAFTVAFAALGVFIVNRMVNIKV